MVQNLELVLGFLIQLNLVVNLNSQTIVKRRELLLAPEGLFQLIFKTGIGLFEDFHSVELDFQRILFIDSVMVNALAVLNLLCVDIGVPTSFGLVPLVKIADFSGNHAELLLGTLNQAVAGGIGADGYQGANNLSRQSVQSIFVTRF